MNIDELTRMSVGQSQLASTGAVSCEDECTDGWDSDDDCTTANG